MTLLSPWSLLWLASVPVLVWLWRMTSSRRQVRVSSLVPFEHLLRRPPRFRSRLFVNVLFWLQLAALIGLAAALSQPVVFGRPARRILAVLDTSASLAAPDGGASAFERARRALLGRIARKAARDEMLIMTTAPVEAATPKPTSDAAALSRAVRALAVNHLGGNLATAARIGRAVMGAMPDEIMLFTDEPAAPQPQEAAVRWVSVGRPLANLAIVSVDASGSLCSPSDARIIATLQSFSDRASAAAVTVSQQGRALAQVSTEIAPRARAALSLELPAGTDGWVDVTLTGQPDGLAVDNRAWVQIRRSAQLPIVVQSESPAFRQTVARWLQACPAASWSDAPPASGGPYLLITDQRVDAATPPTAAMLFRGSSTSAPVRRHWIAAPDHPIAFYLSSVEMVAAALSPSASAVSTGGVPVVSALVGGRRVPVVVAEEQDGGRRVTMFFDPAQSAEAVPVIVTFLNSLRWLMGQAQLGTTGEPLLLDGFRPGPVSVHRPDGTTELVSAQGTVVRYERTTRAGRYRAIQHAVASEAAANFFDPLESDLIGRASTWRPLTGAPIATDRPRRTSYALTPPLLGLLLLLLVGEWLLYAMRGLASRPSPGWRLPTGAERRAPRSAVTMEPLERRP